jgi:deoxyadenosine/deoxycytidine kinase
MGTIGSGKTTVAKLLAKEFRFKLLEEHFGENAFLPRFYADMKRWAFHSQMFFLMEKIKQLLETPKLLQKKSVVQDTPIHQDVFSYAKAQYILENMDYSEWWLYLKVYRSFEPFLPTPDLVVYLETSMEGLEGRIQKRGRSYEQKIPTSYLELLDMLNHKWLRENKSIPVLVVATDDLDIVHSKKAKQQLVAAVKSALRTKPTTHTRQVIRLSQLEA